LGSVLFVLKAEFPSNYLAASAGSLIGDYEYAVLGSAIVVPITRFNLHQVERACAVCGGQICNDKVTRYDLARVL